MKRIMLVLLLTSCRGDACPQTPTPLDCRIESDARLIDCNNRLIDENEQHLKTLQRVQSIRRAVDCANWELDYNQNDSDTVLAVEACLQKEGWRK